MERFPTTRQRFARLIGATSALTMAFVFGIVAPAVASVDIEKTTNGQDADTGSGPTVDEGDTVNWSWRVTASVELYDVVVSDTSGVVPDCDTNGDGVGDGTFIHPGPLEPGQSFVCTASYEAGNAGQTSVAYGEVQAYDFDGSLFQDRDASHHTVVLPVTTTSTTSTTSATSTMLAAGAAGGDTRDEGDLPTSGLSSNQADTDSRIDAGRSNLSPTGAVGSAADSDSDDGTTGGTSRGGAVSTTDDPSGDEPDELAMTSQSGSPSRSNWPIGLGLVTIGVGLLFIGYRLDSLLEVTGIPGSANESGLGDPDVFD